MKHLFTLAILALSFGSFAQLRSPGDSEDVFRSDPPFNPQRDQSANEATVILDGMIDGIRKRDHLNSNSKEVKFLEADYQSLIMRADEYFMQRKFDEAVVLYREICNRKEDQYSKDKLMEIDAIRAKMKQDEEAKRNDEILRAKAEFAAGARGKRVVHFTGGMCSDYTSDVGISRIFDEKDKLSDFLRAGRYDTIRKALKYSISHTLDGIAVPANTRVIIYADLNCKGTVLLDVTGPAVINNVLWREDDRYNDANTKNYDVHLQPYFPQATRSWSESNMHGWVFGSMEILDIY